MTKSTTPSHVRKLRKAARRASLDAAMDRPVTVAEILPVIRWIGDVEKGTVPDPIAEPDRHSDWSSIEYRLAAVEKMVSQIRKAMSAQSDWTRITHQVFVEPEPIVELECPVDGCHCLIVHEQLAAHLRDTDHECHQGPPL